MKVVMMLTCLVVASVAVSEEPITLCGRQLANARLLLCYGDILYEKRTYSQSMFDTLEKEKSWSEDWPWKGLRGVLSAGWNRYKRIGLADECCLKPCTTEVIRRYC